MAPDAERWRYRQIAQMAMHRLLHVNWCLAVGYWLPITDGSQNQAAQGPRINYCFTCRFMSGGFGQRHHEHDLLGC